MSGLAQVNPSESKTPRRPMIIMEGPLVSDTTELLAGAASAPEESPTGQPAAGSEGAAAASRPRGRAASGDDLSKLLVADLQRIAQELGVTGTGRMRKGDLVAAIKDWLEAQNNKTKKPLLPEPDKALLAALRQRCAAFELDEAEKVMDELFSANYEKDAELVAWLREKLDTMEFDEIAERLGDIL